MQHEFDEPTWSLFVAVAVEGNSPDAVAQRSGRRVLEVERAVATVLHRLSGRLRCQASQAARVRQGRAVPSSG